MSDSIKLVIAKDANSGIYSQVDGYNVYLEKDNWGAIIDTECVKSDYGCFVFDCNLDDLFAKLSHFQEIGK